MKKVLYILIAVTLIGGLAFAFSGGGNNLKGLFTVNRSINGVTENIALLNGSDTSSDERISVSGLPLVSSSVDVDFYSGEEYLIAKWKIKTTEDSMYIEPEIFINEVDEKSNYTDKYLNEYFENDRIVITRKADDYSYETTYNDPNIGLSDAGNYTIEVYATPIASMAEEIYADETIKDGFNFLLYFSEYLDSYTSEDGTAVIPARSPIESNYFLNINNDTQDCTELSSSIDSYSSSELYEFTENCNEKVESYKEAASAANSDARLAWSKLESDDLATAQSEAESAATSAELSSSIAQEYADKALEKKTTAETKYEELESTLNTYIDALNDASETYFDAKDAYDNYVDTYNANQECWDNGGNNCNNDYDWTAARDSYMMTAGITENDYGASVDMNGTNNLYTNYQDKLSEYQSYLSSTEYSDASEAVAETKSEDDVFGSGTSYYADEAQTIADQALEYATSARASANSAAVYTVGEYMTYSCSALSLSPDEYEMTADATSADIDLTIDITTVGTSSSTEISFSLKNMLASLLAVTEEMFYDNSDTYEVLETWDATLKLRSSGTGTFTYTDSEGLVSTGTSTLEIPITSESGEAVQVSANYSAGSKGDTITALIVNETICTDKFKISQATDEVVTEVKISSESQTAPVAADEPIAPTAPTTPTATYNDSYITVLDPEDNPITDLDIENFTVSEISDMEIVDFDNSSAKSGIYKFNFQETKLSDYKVLVSSDGYVSGKVEIDDNTADYAASVTLHYGYVVYPVDTDNEGISGATVTAGDAYDTECVEVGTGAIYTCLIPLDNEDITFKVEADGYDVYEGEFRLDRTSDTDNQVKAKAIMTTPEEEEIDEPDTTDDTETLVSDVEDEDEDVEEEDSEKLETDDYCTPFEDIISHWSETDVCTLYTAGFVKGKSDKMYDPDNRVTRAEFLKLIMLEAGYDPADETDLSVTRYADVNPGDWYHDYVALADENGFLWYPTYDNWLPNEPITRGDAILQTIRIAKLTLYDFTTDDSSFSDFDPDSYQAYAIVLGEQYEIIGGYDDGTFKASNTITRAEAAVIVNNAEVIFE